MRAAARNLGRPGADADSDMRLPKRPQLRGVAHVDLPAEQPQPEPHAADGASPDPAAARAASNPADGAPPGAQGADAASETLGGSAASGGPAERPSDDDESAGAVDTAPDGASLQNAYGATDPKSASAPPPRDRLRGLLAHALRARQHRTRAVMGGVLAAVIICLAVLCALVGVGSARDRANVKTSPARPLHPKRLARGKTRRPQSKHQAESNNSRIRRSTVRTTVRTSASATITSFSGSGQTFIATTVTSAGEATLGWQCGGCSHTFFIVTDDPEDAHAISVDSVGQTSGKLKLPPGTYRKIAVLTNGGRWSLRLSAGR